MRLPSAPIPPGLVRFRDAPPRELPLRHRAMPGRGPVHRVHGDVRGSARRCARRRARRRRVDGRGARPARRTGARSHCSRTPPLRATRGCALRCDALRLRPRTLARSPACARAERDDSARRVVDVRGSGAPGKPRALPGYGSALASIARFAGRACALPGTTLTSAHPQPRLVRGGARLAIRRRVPRRTLPHRRREL